MGMVGILATQTGQNVSMNYVVRCNSVLLILYLFCAFIFQIALEQHQQQRRGIEREQALCEVQHE